MYRNFAALCGCFIDIISLVKCPTRDALFEDYRHLIERFSDAIKAQRTASGRAAEFDAQFGHTEERRRECEAARQKLEAHRKKHGC